MHTDVHLKSVMDTRDHVKATAYTPQIHVYNYSQVSAVFLLGPNHVFFDQTV